MMKRFSILALILMMLVAAPQFEECQPESVALLMEAAVVTEAQLRIRKSS